MQKSFIKHWNVSQYTQLKLHVSHSQNWLKLFFCILRFKNHEILVSIKTPWLWLQLWPLVFKQCLSFLPCLLASLNQRINDFFFNCNLHCPWWRHSNMFSLYFYVKRKLIVDLHILSCLNPKKHFPKKIATMHLL
jgi:hypothetical protein